MTIQVTINNFRKVQQASFEIAPVAFLVGENENGKSSIAQAVAMAAAQQPLPKHISKKDAKLLVHDGAKSGKIELTQNDVTSEISWPLAEFKHTGQGKPIYASEFAVGLKNIFSLSNIDKVAYFIQLLKANPSLDDLKVLLPKSLDYKLPDVWKQIEESGWDEAHSTAKSDESELTGQWKMTTGENRWNVSKAGEWRPETWEIDLERAEIDILEITYAEANKAHEDALKAEGAAQFDRKQAEQQAAEKPQLEKQKAEFEEKLNIANTELAELKKLFVSLPTANTDGIPCPECNTQLAYHKPSDLLGNGTLTKAEIISENEQKAREAEIKSVQSDIDNINAEITDLQNQLSTACNCLKSATDAENRLLQQEAATDNSAPVENVETAQKVYKYAEQRLDNFNKVQKATSLYEQILTQKDL